MMMNYLVRFADLLSADLFRLNCEQARTMALMSCSPQSLTEVVRFTMPLD